MTAADPTTRDDRSHRLGRKSIARRLWLSFVLLLAVLAISGIVSSLLLLEVVAIIKNLVEVEEPLERAALEMEINVGESTQGLLNFIHDPQSRHLEKFEDSLDDYGRHAEVFESLMAASGQSALSARVAELHNRHHVLGEEIIDLVRKRDAELTIFLINVAELDELIDESLQKGLDPAAQNHFGKMGAALDLEINADEAVAAINAYVHRPGPELRHEIDDAIEDFRRFLRLYRDTGLSPTEKSVIDHVEQRFDRTIEIGLGLLALSDRLQTVLDDFQETLNDFDMVIDEKIQNVIYDRKQAAHGDTQSRSLFALTVIIGMAVVVLVIAAVSTWIITTRIARSFWTLVGGIDQVAKGNFDHRIKLATDDELGKLGAAFNQMVAQRKQAMDDLDDKNRMLEDLSAKLSKYLSPQIYQSIFSASRKSRSRLGARS